MTPSARSKPSATRQAARAALHALHGQLPPRYGHYAVAWRSDLLDLAAPALLPGARVLDVGAGRRPVVPLDRRPAGMTYVGMDIVRSEMEAAPPGSYDEIIVADVTERQSSLEDQFDLIMSWQVLEHVRSLPQALDNCHAYLHSGGYAVASLSGRFSVFGMLNLMLPRRIGVPLVAQAMRRNPDTVFPAYYDHCYRSALDRLMPQWSHTHILNAWLGAGYFRFLRPLQAAYIFYEEWAAASGRDDLATHYFLQLTK